jgi:hypothetical protein
MADITTIPKNPALKPDENYAGLQQAGLKYIAELGSALWTDYNEHDPGITIMEALCYAITELGYRTSLPMGDLLTDINGTIAEDSYTLFSAKKILTQSPLNIDDYRKLLIDTEGVSNAWLFYHSHFKDSNNNVVPTGEVPIYADCKNDTLTYTVPTGTKPYPVYLKGLYKVLLDLDDDPQLGDLNNSEVVAPNPAIVAPLAPVVSAGAVSLTVIFPAWNVNLVLLTIDADDVSNTLEIDTTQSITQVGTTNAWNVPLIISLPAIPAAVSFTAIVSIGLQPADQTIGVPDITNFFSDGGFNAFVLNLYLKKIQKTYNIIRTATRKLNKNRNLCEDFVSIDLIKDEEIAFCCDIDVAPGADMTEVQANVYFAIDQYLDPPVNFYLLSEMLAKNYTVDQVFNGPRLKHGFIDTTELENTNLRKTIYASEIISKLMNIDSVLAVRNFRMTAYDDNDNVITGESGQSWCITIMPWHKPILSETKSKITFYKNQFPYTANSQQTDALLDQLLALAEGNKLTSHADDLPQPAGTYFPLSNYTSIQYLFPVTYGIGDTGLPPIATNAQIAQTRQLKAYLLFYDQLLADFFSQLQNAKELFSTNDIKQTYYAQYIDGIKDIDQVYKDYPGTGSLQSLLTTQDSSVAPSAATPPNAWQLLYESNETFTDRRNRFLDHLMARFAESFNDYVFLMYSLSYDTQEETKIDPADLITSKIKFLKDYPKISYRRDRAYNYFPQKDDFSINASKLWDTGNVSGLEEKLCLLGGFKDDPPVAPATTGMPSYYRRNLYTLGKYAIIPDPVTNPAGPFQFVYTAGADQLTSIKTYANTTDLIADLPQFLTFILAEENYSIVNESTVTTKIFQVFVVDDNGNNVAQSGTYPTKKAAKAAVQSFITEFNQESDIEGLHLVEHILLRPRDSSFAFAPVCLDDCCDACGDDDPYSFRISVVLPYWPLHLRSMAFRDYFEQIIRSEAPAHTMIKICWVDDVSMFQFEAAYQNWITTLANYKAGTSDIVLLQTANDSLIKILYNLQSQYPVATLHDCEDSTDTNPVVLGKTALGSFKN